MKTCNFGHVRVFNHLSSLHTTVIAFNRDLSHLKLQEETGEFQAAVNNICTKKSDAPRPE